MTDTSLFKPLNLGRLQLQHRVAMAPLTRFRCNKDHVPLPAVVEYHIQRASTPGTLLIAEASMPSPSHCAADHFPGLWTEDQIAGWKAVVDAVHERGCFMFAQICAPGRAGSTGGYPLYAPSAVPLEGLATPKQMTEEEIQECIADFATAARNAIKAGFDGVELHGANGYLIDQFAQDVVNKRTDGWGGSVEKRSRFALEVTKAVVDAIGGDRVAVRLSPWSTFQEMKMEDGTAQFSHLIRGLKEFKLAYLHLIESRVVNNVDCDKKEGLEFAFDIWQNQSPVLVAGGFTPESARRAVDEEYRGHDTVVVFGRRFISTPDLVFRLQRGIELNAYDRATFYTPEQTKGYTDYPFSKEFTEVAA
ncbi:hypothetical protein ACHAQH_007184 [Verticillium albo-atrum]